MRWTVDQRQSGFPTYLNPVITFSMSKRRAAAMKRARRASSTKYLLTLRLMSQRRFANSVISRSACRSSLDKFFTRSRRAAALVSTSACLSSLDKLATHQKRRLKPISGWHPKPGATGGRVAAHPTQLAPVQRQALPTNNAHMSNSLIVVVQAVADTKMQ